MTKYKVIKYMRIDVEDEEGYDTYEEAEKEKENLDLMQPEDIHIIEPENPDLIDLRKNITERHLYEFEIKECGTFLGVPRRFYQKNKNPYDDKNEIEVELYKLKPLKIVQGISGYNREYVDTYHITTFSLKDIKKAIIIEKNFKK